MERLFKFVHLDHPHPSFSIGNPNMNSSLFLVLFCFLVHSYHSETRRVCDFRWRKLETKSEHKSFNSKFTISLSASSVEEWTDSLFLLNNSSEIVKENYHCHFFTNTFYTLIDCFFRYFAFAHTYICFALSTIVRFPFFKSFQKKNPILNINKF